MPRWWKSLCRQARLHNQKEPRRAWESDRRQADRFEAASLEPLEQRVLLSTTLSSVDLNTQLADRSAVSFNGVVEVKQAAPEIAANDQFLADASASQPTQTTLTGTGRSDLLVTLDSGTDLIGRGGDDTLIVNIDDWNGQDSTLVRAGGGNDTIYVTAGKADVRGGAGYDILMVADAEVDYRGVEEVWVLDDVGGTWTLQDSGSRGSYASPTAAIEAAYRHAAESSSSASISLASTESLGDGLFSAPLLAMSSAMSGATSGDLDGDGNEDADDIDMLVTAINAQSTDLTYDLNLDGLVSSLDQDYLIRDLLGTEYGDANLDGRVFWADHQLWLDNFGDPVGWAGADFNGSGVADASDYTVWADNKGFGVPALPDLFDARGDLNANGVFDTGDVELMLGRVGQSVASFPDSDLFADGVIDQKDVDHLVQGYMSTRFEDLNLDGKVDSTDGWIVLGNFIAGTGTTWSEGDLNGDGVVDLDDYTIFTAADGFDNEKPVYLTGTSGDDILYGYRGYDTIDGGGGNDYIWGGQRDDILNGGDGVDTVGDLETGDIASGFEAEDYDDDGLSNVFEIWGLGTDPDARDTDGDRMPDGWEYLYWDGVSTQLNPLVTDDGTDDTDSDGMVDIDEFSRNINPINPDTDGDGASDGQEQANQSNPRDARDQGQFVDDFSINIRSTLVVFKGNYAEDCELVSSDPDYYTCPPSQLPSEAGYLKIGDNQLVVDPAINPFTAFGGGPIYTYTKGQNYDVEVSPGDDWVGYRALVNAGFSPEVYFPGYDRLFFQDQPATFVANGILSFKDDPDLPGINGYWSESNGTGRFDTLVIPSANIIIDSDNNNGFDLPDNSDTESRLEQDPNSPKLIPTLGYSSEDPVEGQIVPFQLEVSENFADFPGSLKFRFRLEGASSGQIIYYKDTQGAFVPVNLGTEYLGSSLGVVPGSTTTWYLRGGTPSQSNGPARRLSVRVYSDVHDDDILAYDDAYIKYIETIDLDIDSNNSNGFDLPDRDIYEELAESDSRGAKVVVVNRDDSDHDGVIDYADGFGQHGVTSDTVENEQFTPIQFEIPVGAAFGDTIRFDYSNSPLDLVNVTPHTSVGLDGETYGYDEFSVGGDGLLRLWNTTDSEIRSANDLIQSGQDYVVGDFDADANGVVTLLVEAVKGSATPTNIVVQFEGLDGRIGTDSVYVLPVDPEIGIASDDIEGITVRREAGSHYYGDSGNDLFFGTDLDEHFEGGGGHDIIFTGGGDDTVVGGEDAHVYADPRGLTLLSWDSGDAAKLIKQLKYFKSFSDYNFSAEAVNRMYEAYEHKYRQMNPINRAAMDLFYDGRLSFNFSRPENVGEWYQEVKKGGKDAQKAMFKVVRSEFPDDRDANGAINYRYLVNIFAPAEEPVFVADAFHLSLKEIVDVADPIWLGVADTQFLSLVSAYEVDPASRTTKNSGDFEIYNQAVGDLFEAAAATSELYLRGLGVISIGAELAFAVDDTALAYEEAGLYAAITAATIATVGLALPVLTPGATRLVVDVGGSTLGKLVTRVEDLSHEVLRNGDSAYNTSKLTDFVDELWYPNVRFSAFEAGTEKAIVLQEPGIFYRYVSSEAESLTLGSGFLSPVTFGSSDEAIRKLALPNTTDAQYIQMVKLDAGTEVIIGKVRARSGDPGFPADAPGGAEQIYVLDRGDNVEVLKFNLID